MEEQGWDPWNATAIGMAVVLATALVTCLMVANWVLPQILATSAHLSENCLEMGGNRMTVATAERRRP